MLIRLSLSSMEQRLMAARLQSMKPGLARTVQEIVVAATAEDATVAVAAAVAGPAADTETGTEYGRYQK
jgi:hypothetical protein